MTPTPSGTPTPMRPIPVHEARSIAAAYGYDQVIIIARRVGDDPAPHGEHVTTYGRSEEHCSVAGRVGNFIKHKIMGWPEYEPSEIRADRDRLREALKQIIDMNIQYARDRFGNEAEAESMSFNRIRDPGMANNARSYARKIRALSLPPAPARGGERVSHDGEWPGQSSVAASEVPASDPASHSASGRGQPSPSSPSAGYVLVPREPTSDMVDEVRAVYHAWKSRDDGWPLQRLARDLWDAMIDAAPRPASKEAGE